MKGKVCFYACVVKEPESATIKTKFDEMNGTIFVVKGRPFFGCSEEQVLCYATKPIMPEAKACLAKDKRVLVSGLISLSEPEHLVMNVECIHAQDRASQTFL